MNTFSSYGNEKDQILKELKTAPETKKIELLTQLSKLYRFDDWNKSMEYINKALCLSSFLKDSLNIALCHKEIGSNYYLTSDVEQAKKHFNHALSIYISINDLQGQCNLYNNLGLIYRSQGNHDSARYNYNKSIELEKKCGNELGAALTLCNVTNILIHEGEYDSALTNLIFLQKIFSDYNKPTELLKTHINLGVIYMENLHYEIAAQYFNLGLDLAEKNNLPYEKSMCLSQLGIVYHKLGDEQLALQLLNESLLIKRHIKNHSGEIPVITNMGIIQMRSGKLDEAYKLFTEALDCSEKVDDKYLIAQIHLSIGEVLLLKNHVEKSIQMILKGIEIAKSINCRPTIIDGYEKLIMAYSQLKQYDYANKYLKAYSSLNDSVKLTIIESDILALYAKDQQEETHWIKRNQIYLYIVTAFILLAIFFTLHLFLKKSS